MWNTIAPDSNSKIPFLVGRDAAEGIERAVRGLLDRLHQIQCAWQDEAAFDEHAELAHTIVFLTRAKQLVDGPIEMSRLRTCFESER
jgi:hypothetical protein